ncbi:hypothetical protein bcgnr5369_67070 [Bacillus cereus]
MLGWVSPKDFFRGNTVLSYASGALSIWGKLKYRTGQQQNKENKTK